MLTPDLGCAQGLPGEHRMYGLGTCDFFGDRALFSCYIFHSRRINNPCCIYYPHHSFSARCNLFGSYFAYSRCVIRQRPSLKLFGRQQFYLNFPWGDLGTNFD